jgi:hypothetical protein
LYLGHNGQELIFDLIEVIKPLGGPIANACHSGFITLGIISGGENVKPSSSE